jgi:preprotein translocase subunit SecB
LARPTLQLESYFFPKIHIGTDPEYEASQESPIRIQRQHIDIKTSFSLLSQEEREWGVNLEIKTVKKERPIPYIIHIEAVGFFKVAKGYPSEEIEKLVQIGGSTLLYSAIREFILTISSRGPWGSVFIPSVSFLPSPKESEKKSERPDEGEKDAGAQKES